MKYINPLKVKGTYLGSFFSLLTPLPIPVPNKDGDFGGFYYTSTIQELLFGNFIGFLGFIFAFSLMGYFIHSLIIGDKD